MTTRFVHSLFPVPAQVPVRLPPGGAAFTAPSGTTTPLSGATGLAAGYDFESSAQVFDKNLAGYHDIHDV
jgi:uncharacterized protein YhjY with autotransporter beta-barrel domain